MHRSRINGLLIDCKTAVSHWAADDPPRLPAAGDARPYIRERRLVTSV